MAIEQPVNNDLITCETTYTNFDTTDFHIAYATEVKKEKKIVRPWEVRQSPIVYSNIHHGFTTKKFVTKYRPAHSDNRINKRKSYITQQRSKTGI